MEEGKVGQMEEIGNETWNTRIKVKNGKRKVEKKEDGKKGKRWRYKVGKDKQGTRNNDKT